MIVDGGRGSEDRTFEKNQSSARDLSRRKALGRLGAYTAPAMLAMLLSEPAAAASITPG